MTQREIIRLFCPHTLATLFRNHIVTKFPASFAIMSNGDRFLYGTITAKGYAGYIPRVVAHYCQHGGGVWTLLNEEKRYRTNLHTTLAMLEHFQGQYQAEFMFSINWYYTKLCTLLWQQKRWGEFWQLYSEFTLLSIRALNGELSTFTLRVLMGRLLKAA